MNTLIWNALSGMVRPFYEGSYKHYHTWHHVDQVKRAAISLIGKGNYLTDAQALAILFHDAVYIPGEKTNEIMSADLMSRTLKGVECGWMQIPDEEVAKAYRIILATSHHFGDAEFDEETNVILDADLGSLSVKEVGVFHSIQIRILMEFPHVSKDKRLEGQCAMFKRLLDKPRIYRSSLTTYPQLEEWEQLARRNIRDYCGIT